MNSIFCLAFAVAVLTGSVIGARIQQHAAGAQIGPPGFTVEGAHLVTPGGAKIGWSRKAQFVCTVKWEKAQTKKKWTGKTCLANMEDVIRGQEEIKRARAKGKDTPLIQGAKDFQKCQSSKKPWMLKLCPLKGKEDVRLSYSQNIHLPKSAFFGAREWAHYKISVAKVAVDLGGLAKEMQKSPQAQSQWKSEDALLVPKLAKPVVPAVEVQAGQEASDGSATELEETAETVPEEVQTAAETSKEQPEPDDVAEENDDEDVISEEAAENFVDLDDLDFKGKMKMWAERDDGQTVKPRA